MTAEARIAVGVNLEVAVRSVLAPGRPCVILSGGFGIFDFDEPVQVALTESLERQHVGWIQYQYPERRAGSPTTDMLISSGVHALGAVRSWARAQTAGPVGLFGISFGANVSLEAALLEQPAVLLLINPVFDYVEYRTRQLGNEALRSWSDSGRLTIEYAHNVTSYYRFIEEAKHQDLMARIADLVCPMVACQASEDPILGRGYVERLGTQCPQATTHVIPGADHAFADADSIATFIKIAEAALHGWFRADLVKRAA